MTQHIHNFPGMVQSYALLISPTDASLHGTVKLVSYFNVMSYCLVSRHEKLMFTPYFNDLWLVFMPKLSEPAIPQHFNKQVVIGCLISEYTICM